MFAVLVCKQVVKRLLVVTTKFVCSFKLGVMKQYAWRLNLDKIGLMRLVQKTGKFTILVPSNKDNYHFECPLAARVCKLISDLAQKHNCNNMRYMHVVKDEDDLKFANKGQHS
jgi:hypothetical protein